MIRRPPRSTLFPYTTLFRSPDPLPAFARLVGAAYPGEELDAEVGPVVDEALAEALEPGWFRDRIAARLAARSDDLRLLAAATAAQAARSGPLLARMRGMLALELALIGVGLFALGRLAWRRGALAR